MAAYHLISADRLRQLLSYDKNTGKFFWRTRPVSDFVNKGRYAPDRLSKIWNSGNAGKEALCSIASHGYKAGCVDNASVLAHRVAWCYNTGKWPDNDIDHINGDKLDNRIENLRDVNQSINQQNARGKITNTSGANGVSWDKSRGKWRARAMVNYKEIFIGRFDTFDDAVSARISAEKNYEFTSMHGDLSHKEPTA